MTLCPRCDDYGAIPALVETWDPRYGRLLVDGWERCLCRVKPLVAVPRASLRRAAIPFVKLSDTKGKKDGERHCIEYSA